MSLTFPARSSLPPIRFDLERMPGVLAFVRTWPGRVLLIAVCALLLRPMISLWPAMAVAAVAMSCVDRRHAGMVTAIATAAVFALSPNWYMHDTLAAGSRDAGALESSRAWIDWAAPVLVVAISIVFLAAVRTGRPRLVAAYPQVALILAFLVLLSVASVGPGSPEIRLWLWSLTSAFSGYMWVVALVAVEQRNRSAQVPFFEMLGSLHPFWTLHATPYTLAPGKLRRLSARDEADLIVSQIKAFKLLMWAYALVLVSIVFDDVVHRRLGVPTFREALDAFRMANVAWSTRWLSLFVDFFDSILHLAIAGHVVIACARLSGYNLPRNTYRPLGARTVAEFWGRYFYYFKELMLNLFYFPTYFACFRSRPQLRAAFATFMAAGVGNLMFHAIREFQPVAELGPWQAFVGLQTYAFYCVALSTGIAISQWRASRHRRPAASGLPDRVLSFLGVMIFFCLLHIFDDMRRTVPLSEHLQFLVSLFEPWS